MTNQGWTYTDVIDASNDGRRLLDFYAERYRHSGREVWEERILSGQVLVEGQTTFPDFVLRRGQRLAYQRPPWQEPEAPLDFEVFYEDEDLLVVNKPSGLPVLPGGGFLEHTLLHQVRRRFPGENPSPVHRLGRGTSGLVLFARSSHSSAGLSRQIHDRHVEKIYLARVGSGELPDQFRIDQPIGRAPHPFLGQIHCAIPDGKPARSDCRVLVRTALDTLVEVSIHTGRAHQIRIHLASAGFPLLGDPLYAPGGVARTNPGPTGTPVPGDCGYLLHAWRLAFHHPRSGAFLSFTAPPSAGRLAELTAIHEGTEGG